MELDLQMMMTEEFKNCSVTVTKNGMWEKTDCIGAKDTLKLRLRN